MNAPIPPPPFRWAAKSDGRAMAELIAIAGEGIPTFLWSQMAKEGQTPLDVGELRAMREEGGYSYKNAVLADIDGPVAMLLAYPLPEPTNQDRAEAAELPPLLRPLAELEHEAPGSFYVNALAVRESQRGRGLGSALLDFAEDLARAKGCPQVSIQVFSQNEGAKRLYLRKGYRIADERPIVAHPCYPYDDRALLLLKDV